MVPPVAFAQNREQKTATHRVWNDTNVPDVTTAKQTRLTLEDDDDDDDDDNFRKQSIPQTCESEAENFPTRAFKTLAGQPAATADFCAHRTCCPPPSVVEVLCHSNRDRLHTPPTSWGEKGGTREE